MTASTKVTKAVFPIAGYGTRFLPATKAMPKEMLPVVDKPLIQYAVDEAIASGIDELIFVTGSGRGAIEDHFDYNYEIVDVLTSRGQTDALAAVERTRLEPGQVAYLRQQEPLGLGHAVWCARRLIGDEPFAVLLADDLVVGGRPALGELLEVHGARGGNVVAVQDVPRPQTGSYGILDVEADDGRVATARGVVEKPDPEAAPSTLAVIGRYVLEPLVLEHLARTARGAGGEIQLTDAIAAAAETRPLSGVRLSGTRYDCGTKEGWLEANVACALDHPELGDAARAILHRHAGQGANQD